MQGDSTALNSSEPAQKLHMGPHLGLLNSQGFTQVCIPSHTAQLHSQVCVLGGNEGQWLSWGWDTEPMEGAHPWARLRAAQSRGQQQQSPSGNAELSFADTSLQLPLPPPPACLLSYTLVIQRGFFPLGFRSGKASVLPTHSHKVRLQKSSPCSLSRERFSQWFAEHGNLTHLCLTPDEWHLGIWDFTSALLGTRAEISNKRDTFLPRACRPCPAEVTEPGL